MNDESYRPWMKTVLLAAAAYNLAWGTWVILRPADLFVWTGIAPPTYPGIWQCVGMIVGVYGIGYAIAAFNPLRHWPIVLVGLLGKVLGPIGMLQNLFLTDLGTSGRLPASWLWLNLTNDVIWWLPFTAILYAAFRQWNRPDTTGKPASIQEANQNAMTQTGVSLAKLSAERNVLIVFLRHSDCTFCREALADIAANRDTIEEKSTIAFVHMGLEDKATQSYFEEYGLGDVHRISDPTCQLYQAYDLERGKFQQLLGPSVWWRGFKAAILNRHAVGKPGGDGFQMPGAFVIRDNQIVQAFRHETAADRPDYCQLSTAT